MAVDLVTGGTGLLGGNLIRTLTGQGRRVRALVRNGANVTYIQDLQGVELVYGDITDPPSLASACQGIENLYHCAALTYLWMGMAEKLRQVNVEGTKHVVQAAISADVKRLIHCSTVGAIGLPEAGALADEDTVWNWDRLGVEDPYARTKFESQSYVLDMAGDKLDAVVVNPTTMFGAYDIRPSSGQIILLIAGGKLPFYPTGGDNFVDVEDVAQGMVHAAEKGTCGSCYILGNENVTYKDIFRRIAAILNVNPPGIKIPYAIARIGGWFGDLMGTITGREQTINSSSVQLGALHQYYSSQKALDELAIPQTPVDEAIERAAQWFYDTGKIPVKV